MGDENDGLAEALGECAEFALKLGAGHWVEGTKGFVHEEDWRVGSKGTRYSDALALATGEFVWSARSMLGGFQTNQCKEIVDTRGCSRSIPIL